MHARSCQIALADRIILNKVDLVGCDGTNQVVDEATVLATIRAVNGSAGVLRAVRADVPLLELLDLRAFSSAEWLSHLATGAEARVPYDVAHANSIACTSLHLATPIELPRLQVWLQELMARQHEDIYRIKGVLCIDGCDERFVLHGVHAEVSGHFERPWIVGEARSSSMVVIGHCLDGAELTRAFEACAADVGDATPCGACTEGGGIMLDQAEHARLKVE